MDNLSFKLYLLAITIILLFISLWFGIDSFVKTCIGAVIGYLIARETH